MKTVDVLAVMHDAAAAGPSIHCTNQRTGEIHSHELHEAHDAVARLIEAARQLHADSLPFADGSISPTLGTSRENVRAALAKVSQP
jgi:hypothetical protein